MQENEPPSEDDEAADALAAQAFEADFTRMICDELDLIQLETINRMLFRIGSSGDPVSSRNAAIFYDGVTRGILTLRRRIETEGLAAPEESTMWSHPHEGDPTRRCIRCGMTDELSRPHRRWEEGLRGNGSDDV